MTAPLPEIDEKIRISLGETVDEYLRRCGQAAEDMIGIAKDKKEDR